MATYGSEGAWAMLFRRAPGFIGTRLLQDREDPSSFLTLDIWSNQAAQAAFMARFREAYETLGRETAHLTSLNLHIGTVESPAYETGHSG